MLGNGIISWIDNYLKDERLKPVEQLNKRWAWIWMVVTFIGSLFSSFLFLFVLKLWPIWWFGFAMIVSYLISLPLFRRIKRFDLVINLMFSFFIVLAFIVLLQVGGLPSSLGFIFIGFNCAMGSVLAGRLKWTVGMFTLYCLSIILIGLLQPQLETPVYITPRINTIAFVILTLWINACILFLVILFMKDKSMLEKSEADKLRKIDEIKTQLYTNLSHEFRTPLTVISGISEQLQKNPKKWLTHGPNKIKTQSNVLLRLVNQMLDISKIEAGGMKLMLIHGDINKIIEFIVSSFNSLTENKKIKLNLNTHQDSIYADYDPEKIMHILGNLISNAIKFTSKGGEINIDVLSENDKLKIIVRDNGKGISNEHLKHIFDRFYQIPDSNNETQGTGLGLTITKELVLLLNGSIEVKSELNIGSEFHIILPLSNEAQLEIDNGVSLINPKAIQVIFPAHDLEWDIEYPSVYSNEPILLLVEDNKDVVEYLISILNDKYSVVIASNGKEGLKKAKKIIPDVIITDIMMPQMDGYELIEKIKSDIVTDHIPVIVLTARGDFDSKLIGLEIGADHYLTKPFSEEELILKVKNLLSNRKKMQSKLGISSALDNQESIMYKRELIFMSKINKLLDENIENENFGIKDICNALNFSRSQFYRKFSVLADGSIGKYIRSYRLHKAKILIEVNGKNVSEAARDTGFKNLSHFSTSFTEEFGFPPSELLQSPHI